MTMAECYELGGRGPGKAVRRPDTLGRTTPLYILAFGAASALVAVLMVAANLMGLGPGEGSDISQAQVDAALLWWPIAAAIGAVASLTAGYLARRRRCWRVCIACMCVADISVLLYAVPAVEMVVISVILLVVGLLMTIRINANRDAFADR